MKLIIKSAFIEDQILYKKELNNNFEMQLLNEYESGISNCTLFEKIKKYDINIETIHTPILNGNSVCFDELYDDKIVDSLKRTCELANIIGEYYNKSILVIVHFTTSIKTLKNNNDLKIIDELLKFLLDKHPYIKIGLENLIPIIINKNECNLKEGYMFENCDYVKYFTLNYGYEGRIGTVLDISHAIITIRLLKYCDYELYLEDYFANNKDLVLSIHLANTRGSGYEKGQHGCGFLDIDEDIDLLNLFLRLYKKYNYSCPIVLEIEEEDYLNCINYLNSLELLSSALKTNNLIF